MKIAGTSDWHLDSRGRLADTVSVLESFLSACRQEKVDLIVHGGDVFDRTSGPEERAALLDFLEAAHGIPVVIAAGNHDAKKDLDLFGRIRPDVHVFERPGSVVVGNAFVYALPWFDKRFLVGQLDASVDAESSRHTALQATGVLLEGIGREIAAARERGQATVVVAHAMVSGSETSTGQTLQGVGLDLSPSSLYDLGADYVALGHIHKAQQWYDGKVRYSGSPSRLNFGEPEEKGWVLVSIEDGKTRSEFRPLPARKMVLLEATSDGTFCAKNGEPIDGRLDDGPVGIKEGLVRIRVKVPESELATFDPKIWERRFPDAHEVKVEPIVVRETRARAPEISTQKSTWDKVSTYLDAKSVDVDRERLQSKLASLEAP